MPHSPLVRRRRSAAWAVASLILGVCFGLFPEHSPAQPGAETSNPNAGPALPSPNNSAPPANTSAPPAAEPANSGVPPTAPGTAPPATTAPATTAPAATPPPMDSSAPNKAGVEAMLKQLEADLGLDPELKKKQQQNYSEALTLLQAAEQSAAAAAAFRETARTAPDRVKAAEAQAVQNQARPNDLAESTLDGLQTMLTEAEARLDNGRKSIAEFEAAPSQFKIRREELFKLETATKTRLDGVNAELSKPLAPGDSPEAVQSRRTLLLARKAAAETELLKIAAERDSIDARERVLASERDAAAAALKIAEQRVAELTDTIRARKDSDAGWELFLANGAAASVQKLKNTPPSLSALANQNLALAKERFEKTEEDEPSDEAGAAVVGLPKLVAHLTKLQGEIDATFRDLQQRYKNVVEKAEVLGSNDVIGELLRSEQAKLPDAEWHRDRIAFRQELMAMASFRIIDLQHDRAELSNLDERIDAEMKALAAEVGQDQAEALKPRLRNMLEKQRVLLDKLIADYEAYRERMVQLNVSRQELIQETDKYADFIAEHILWIRSMSPLGPGDFSQAWDSAKFFGSGRVGRQLMAGLWEDAWNHLWIYLLAGLALVAGLVLQQRIRVKLHHFGEEAARSNAQSMRPTVYASLLTFALAAVLPVALWFISRRMALSSEEDLVQRAVSAALWSVALTLFTTNLFRQICRPKGLGESHFGWEPSALRRLRSLITWIIVLALPVDFLVALIDAQEIDRRFDSLGRLLFMVGMIGMAFVGHRMVRAFEAVVKPILPEDEDSRKRWIQYVWMPVSLVVPLGLAVISIMGYYYTAVRLSSIILMTIWLMIGVQISQALLVRWLLITRRRLALENARRLREAALNKAQNPTAAPPPAPDALDLNTANLQTQRLIRTLTFVAGAVGIYLVWVDVFPALGVFRRIELWKIADASVTLADFGWAAALLALTFVGGANLPGLLEIAVLKQLPMDTGGRYAVTTVCRYVITILGLIFAAGAIGLNWSQVQWLAAAITVGVGIGLQDIFANFFSGLIILFERPIRVGDLVTVGGISGKVTRIRMRATVITDWDAKELIIPNKDIITGSVVNWTLSDRRLRLIVKIGVAYGTDTRRVTDLLREIAESHPHVMRDPAPEILFLAFGDSGLDFELRVLVADLSNGGPTQHELRQTIAERFAAEGIEIPFPQRDLRIRSIDPELLSQFELHARADHNGRGSS